MATKNEKIAYTAGWISSSYPIKPPKYRDEKLAAAYDKGVADRAAMYEQQMQQVRKEVAR